NEASRSTLCLSTEPRRSQPPAVFRHSAAAVAARLLAASPCGLCTPLVTVATGGLDPPPAGGVPNLRISPPLLLATNANGCVASIPVRTLNLPLPRPVAKSAPRTGLVAVKL